jgi:hypothetical protein
MVDEEEDATFAGLAYIEEALPGSDSLAKGL